MSVRLTLLLVTAAIGLAAEPRVSHVIVIGIDGLSPQGIAQAETPHIDALAVRGAFTWQARAVFPTKSSPNWASMIMGAGPEQHGVTSNAWELDDHEIAPVAQGPGGMFPTIFGLLRQQHPEAVIAVFHDWRGFARLLETDLCDVVQHFDGDKRTSDAAFAATAAAADYFKETRPHLLFLHLDHVDHAGHGHGWYSEPYEIAVREADWMVGQVIAAITDAGATADTVVLLTSDHGGIDKGHGGFTKAELEIPWVIAGPGIRSDHVLEDPVNTYDTAATLAHLLDVEPPEAWIARPVAEAFDP